MEQKTGERGELRGVRTRGKDRAEKKRKGRCAKRNVREALEEETEGRGHDEKASVRGMKRNELKEYYEEENIDRTMKWNEMVRC